MNALQEFAAGWCGGVSGLVVGHPFDTVKSRLQTQGVGGREMRYTGTFHCFSDIVKTEGLRGLYKGMAAPLLGMAAINSIVFSVHGSCMRFLQPQGGVNKINNSLIAGAAAGTVQCVVCTPAELIKLRMQVQCIGTENGPSISNIFTKKNKKSNYVGPWETAVEIYKKEGIKGINKGMVVTMYREAPAFATYFASYDYFCQKVAGQRSLDELGPLALCFCGGISGINAWIITYPFDVIKSRLQTDGINEKPQYNGMMDCFKKSYHNDGWKVFFRGLNSTLLRAFPTNAATFSTVTLLLRYWRREEI